MTVVLWKLDGATIFLLIVLEVYRKRWWRRAHFFLGGSYNEKTMGVFCKMSAVQQHWKLLAVVSQVS